MSEAKKMHQEISEDIYKKQYPLHAAVKARDHQRVRDLTSVNKEAFAKLKYHHSVSDIRHFSSIYPQHYDHEYNTPLQIAARMGDISLVVLLGPYSMVTQLKPYKGISLPLRALIDGLWVHNSYYAAYRNKVEEYDESDAVRWLFTLAVDNIGSPLPIALAGGYKSLVGLMLKYAHNGALELEHPAARISLLHFAAATGLVTLAKAIIQHEGIGTGSSFQMVDTQGRTIEDYANPSKMYRSLGAEFKDREEIFTFLKDVRAGKIKLTSAYPDDAKSQPVVSSSASTSSSSSSSVSSVALNSSVGSMLVASLESRSISDILGRSLTTGVFNVTTPLASAPASVADQDDLGGAITCTVL